MARRSQSKSSDPIYRLFDALINGVGWLIAWPFRQLFGTSLKDKQLAQARAIITQEWSRVERLVSDSTPASQKEAIMQADILLHKGLTAAGLVGSNLGDQLKSAEGKWDRADLDTAWRAHKVRNRLAHELGYHPGPSEVRQTLNDFRHTLRLLGVL